MLDVFLSLVGWVDQIVRILAIAVAWAAGVTSYLIFWWLAIVGPPWLFYLGVRGNRT
jgi:hypothetical protein